jgi:peptidyl-tRNA hydrolase, PTH1 family
VVVIHDELDLAFGDNRIKVGGGTAGHNGLKSMLQHCGGDGFVRVRMGIGRPRSEKGGDAVISHVLGDFSASERTELPAVLDHAALGVESIVEKGIAQAMNAFNARKKPGI